MKLELIRSADDKRRYDLDGIGSVRHLRRTSYDAELRPVDGAPLVAVPKGIWQRRMEVTDPAGELVGSFEQRSGKARDGDLSWRGAAHELTSDSGWDYGFSLSAGARPSMSVRAGGWGRDRTEVTLHDAGPDGALDPALVLFVVWLAETFVVQDLTYVAGAT